eukprot:TRINITY_DN6648_c0_g1_i1.p1 TRINITY_DN6648_c0_g1~~TRINITY_DN6648_c0_g1_i1.p1  ORF type:complete len:962 (+),score=183.67 TRINITY_DN6648_c0_g1_i1:72-2957(+)
MIAPVPEPASSTREALLDAARAFGLRPLRTATATVASYGPPLVGASALVSDQKLEALFATAQAFGLRPLSCAGESDGDACHAAAGATRMASTAAGETGSVAVPVANGTGDVGDAASVCGPVGAASAASVIGGMGAAPAGVACEVGGGSSASTASSSPAWTRSNLIFSTPSPVRAGCGVPPPPWRRPPACCESSASPSFAHLVEPLTPQAWGQTRQPQSHLQDQQRRRHFQQVQPEPLQPHSLPAAELIPHQQSARHSCDAQPLLIGPSVHAPSQLPQCQQLQVQPRPRLSGLLALRGVSLRLELCPAPRVHLEFLARCGDGPWPEDLQRELLAAFPSARIASASDRPSGEKIGGDCDIVVNDGLFVGAAVLPAAAYDAMELQLRRLAGRCGATLEPLPLWVRRIVGLASSADVAAIPGVPPLGMPREEAARRAREASSSLPRPLFEYQVEGVAFGLHRGGRVLLGDEMGLGKTVQALVLAAAYEAEWPLLIVAPSSLRFTWREQCAQWLPQLAGSDGELVHVVTHGKDRPPPKSRVIVATYDLVRRFHYLRVRPDGRDFLVVIVDESQNIKDIGSQRSKIVVGLCKAARRVVLLSGTPTLNRAAELYAQLEALLPTEMPSFNAFAERYCVLETQRIGRNRTVERWGGVARAAELNVLLNSSVMIRRLKKSVLQQLPSKRRMRIPLNPELMDQDVLRDVVSQVRRLGSGGGADDERFLADLRASSVSGVAAARAGDASISDLFRRTAEAKLGAVCDHVEHLLRTGSKFLLFGHHHHTLDNLERKLRELRTDWVRIDGGTSPAKRPALVARFQEDDSVRVALLSITAAGAGLTLTAAHTVVFAELYWVPGQLQQAEDRAHRVGQKDSVSVQYLVARETLDDIVFRSLERKTRDTSTILDGASGEGGLKVEDGASDDQRLQSAGVDDSECAAASLTAATKRPRLTPSTESSSEACRSDGVGIGA